MSTPTPGRPGTLGFPTDREDAGALLAVGQVSDHREDEVTTRVAQGLVRRTPHPTDRRAKLVEATRKGKTLARRADEILSTPPAALSSLRPEDLETLRRILMSVETPK